MKKLWHEDNIREVNWPPKTLAWPSHVLYSGPKLDAHPILNTLCESSEISYIWCEVWTTHWYTKTKQSSRDQGPRSLTHQQLRCQCTRLAPHQTCTINTCESQICTAPVQRKFGSFTLKKLKKSKYRFWLASAAAVLHILPGFWGLTHVYPKPLRYT